MKESHGKGPASRPDPESCVDGRKAAGEALTGAHAGQPSSCEITSVRGADAVDRSGRQHRGSTLMASRRGPRAVEDPAHAWKLLAREPGDPTATRRRWCDGSAGEGHQPYVRHARRREVGRSHSTGEAAEQRRTETSAEAVEGRRPTKGNACRRPRPGHRAGMARRPGCNVCVKQHAG